MNSPAPEGDEAGDPTYAFKPSLLGTASGFSLAPDALLWQVGSRTGRIRYDRIRAVRLSYRPVTMQSHRFIAEIWAADNPKLQIASVSWRSLVEQRRQDEAYSAFIAELHRRLAAAGSTARFTTGVPAGTYWIGLVLLAAVMAAIGGLVVRAMMLGQWSASAIVAVFFVVFAVQIGNYFRRNRPIRYRADAIPASVLPRS
jgi:hypothetical protein